MDQANPDYIVEIHDPETDSNRLMQTLQQRIEARRQLAQAQGLDYLHLVDEPNPAERFDGEALEMADQIQLIRRAADGLRLAPIVTDWRVPFLNPVINRLKNMLHALVLMYVNTLAGRQIAVNRSLTGILLLVVTARQTDLARLGALEKEVAALKEKLALVD